jgi:hypothetical protein
MSLRAQIQQSHNHKYQCIDILHYLTAGIDVNIKSIYFLSLERILDPNQALEKDPKVDDSEFLILFRLD